MASDTPEGSADLQTDPPPSDRQDIFLKREQSRQSTPDAATGLATPCSQPDLEVSMVSPATLLLILALSAAAHGLMVVQPAGVVMRVPTQRRAAVAIMRGNYNRQPQAASEQATEAIQIAQELVDEAAKAAAAAPAAEDMDEAVVAEEEEEEEENPLTFYLAGQWRQQLSKVAAERKAALARRDEAIGNIAKAEAELIVSLEAVAKESENARAAAESAMAQALKHAEESAIVASGAARATRDRKVDALRKEQEQEQAALSTAESSLADILRKVEKEEAAATVAASNERETAAADMVKVQKAAAAAQAQAESKQQSLSLALEKMEKEHAAAAAKAAEEKETMLDAVAKAEERAAKANAAAIAAIGNL